MLGNSTTSSTKEEQLAQVLGQIEGVGQVTVFIYEQETEVGLLMPQQQEIGVLIVAEGAHSPKVRKQLADTVQRVLKLASHRIAILPMKEGEQD